MGCLTPRSMTRVEDGAEAGNQRRIVKSHEKVFVVIGARWGQGIGSPKVSLGDSRPSPAHDSKLHLSRRCHCLPEVVTTHGKDVRNPGQKLAKSL
jgi:hypothetical protein